MSGIESNSYVSNYSLKEWWSFFQKSNKAFKAHPRPNNIIMLVYINKQFSIFKPIVTNSILLHLRTSALVQAGQSKNKASISYSIRIITFGGSVWSKILHKECPTSELDEVFHPRMKVAQQLWEISSSALLQLLHPYTQSEYFLLCSVCVASCLFTVDLWEEFGSATG